jgi:hypothetical protein
VVEIVVQDVAENRCEASNHILGEAGILHHQGTDGVEAVEKEMGIDLCLECAQLRFAECELEPDLLLAIPASGGERNVEEQPDAIGAADADPGRRYVRGLREEITCALKEREVDCDYQECLNGAENEGGAEQAGKGAKGQGCSATDAGESRAAAGLSARCCTRRTGHNRRPY